MNREELVRRFLHQLHQDHFQLMIFPICQEMSRLLELMLRKVSVEWDHQLLEDSILPQR